MHEQNCNATLQITSKTMMRCELECLLEQQRLSMHACHKNSVPKCENDGDKFAKQSIYSIKCVKILDIKETTQRLNKESETNNNKVKAARGPTDNTGGVDWRM